jgi:hypothetical protein
MARRFAAPALAVFAVALSLSLVAVYAIAETGEADQGQTATAAAPSGPPLALLRFGDSTLRLGALLQPTYDAIQDVNSGGYSQNFYLRRARFYVLGKLGKKVGEGVQEVEFLFLVLNARAGNAAPPAGTKNTGTTGFQIQDAYGQWAFGGNAIALQAGLFWVPTVRQTLTRPSAFLALDTATWATQQSAALGAAAGRDYGVGLNGYLLDDHIVYRAGVFSGNRQPSTSQPAPPGPAACCRNSPRFAGRVMYEFFDSEKGYLYAGTYQGTRKVVAVGAVADTQGSYEGFGGDVFVDWPVGPDALTYEADYIHYSGWGKFYSASIPEQETLWMNAGWYFGALQLQPFARYEFLHYGDAANASKAQERFGGGFNYYVMGQNFKITPYYERILPKVQPPTAKQKDANRFVIQFQAFL